MIPEQTKKMKKTIFILTILMLAIHHITVYADVKMTKNVSVTDEIYCMHFDDNGLLWIGTSSGVKMYNGDKFTGLPAFSLNTCPQLFFEVRSISSDQDYLWIGTNDGLVRLTRATGQTKHYQFPKQSQHIINKLFISSTGTLYVGTDDGFSIYTKKNDRFTHFNYDNAKAIYPNGKRDKYAGWGVKDFCEAPNGDILIGTWGQGIWKFSPKSRQIHAYNKINWANSAFTLCIDRKQQLWIGTQAYGLQRTSNWKDTNLQNLEYLSKDDERLLINDIVELPDGSIFTCVGDTIAGEIGPDDALWLMLSSGNIVRIKQTDDSFINHPTGWTRSLMTTDGRHFFYGIGNHGYGWTDISTNEVRKNKSVPGFDNIPGHEYSPRITSIVRRYNGEIWMAAGDNGILISNPDGSNGVAYPRSSQLPFVKDNVTALLESKKNRTLWLGQRQGVSFILPNGKGQHLEVKNDSIDLTGYWTVNHISEDHKGNIWVASTNRAVVRISGNPSKPATLRFKSYKTPIQYVTACFEDSKHQMWAITPRGLMKYNADKDAFYFIKTSVHLDGKKILTINEDKFGALWLATEQGLVRMGSKGNTECFTKEDGLASSAFYANATTQYGDRLFFGTDGGIIEFMPKAEYQTSNMRKPSLLVLDITIDGTSVLELDTAEIAGIIDSMPVSTRHITISPSVHKFGLNFCLLTYANQKEAQYACLLEGYDDDWHHIEGNLHNVVYDRVPSGTYRFHLKAADSRGCWHELPYTIKVTVLAPWYARWWAWLIYVSLACCIIYFITNYIRMKREMRASHRFSTILQSAQQGMLASTNSTPYIADNKQHNESDTHDNKDENNPVGIVQPNTTSRDAMFVMRATQLVRDNLDDSDYNRDRMAADLSMSVSTLYNRLRDCTGLSIQVFIQTIRLNSACEILKAEPNIRISELAYRVGFNTPKYFSQCFKKEFGVLPGDYVKPKSVIRPKND